MKVVHVIWSLEFGGIERLVLDLATHQQNNGMSVSVLAGQAKGRLAERFAKADIHIIDGKLKSGFDAGLSNRHALRAAFDNADMIHVHTFNMTLAFHAAASGTPILFTDHGNYGLGRRRTWRDTLKFAAQKPFIHRYVAYMTANSSFTLGLARQHFSMDRVPHQVVPNGIALPAADTTPAADLRATDDANMFLVGTSSRFAGFKRIDRLVRAFAGMKHVPQARLLLVGDGPLRSELEALVDQFGLREKTLFTGFRDDVAATQAAMDVCVFPSESEPFGLVAIETLALGKPTLVMADGGGIAEILGAVEPDNVLPDVAALTMRLESLYRAWIQAPENLQKNRKRYIEYANRFTVDQMAHSFQTLYEQLVAGRDMHSPKGRADA